MKLLIVNGYVVDPAQGINAGRNILIEDNRIVGVLDRGEPTPEDAQTFDATGLIVAPGFIDLHTHLREPGHRRISVLRPGPAGAGLLVHAGERMARGTGGSHGPLSPGYSGGTSVIGIR